MKRWITCLLWSCGIAVLALVVAIFYFFMPLQPFDQPTIVAREHLSCGEALVVQRFDGPTYEVMFYFRRSSTEPWGEYFVDNDSPFFRGKLKALDDGRSCVLSFYGAFMGFFACDSMELIHRNGRAYRPKAFVRDPLVTRAPGNGPLDVGADFGDFKGYPWRDR